MAEELILSILAAGQDNPQNPGGDQHPSQSGQGQQGVDRDLQRSLAPQLLGRSVGEIMALLNRRRGTRVRSIRNMMGVPSATNNRQAAGGDGGQGREEESNSGPSYTVERIRVYSPSSFMRMFLPPLGGRGGNGATVVDASTSESSLEAATEEDSATTSSAESSPPQSGRTGASLRERPPDTVSAGQFVGSSAESSALSSSGTTESGEAESSTASEAASVLAAAATAAAGAAAMLESEVRGAVDSPSASPRQQEGSRGAGRNGGQSQPVSTGDCIVDGSEEGSTCRDSAKGGDSSFKVASLSPAAGRSVSSTRNCEHTAQSLPLGPDLSSVVEAQLSTGDGNTSLSGFPSKSMGLGASVQSSLTHSCGLQKESDTKTLEGLVDFEVD